MRSLPLAGSHDLAGTWAVVCNLGHVDHHLRPSLLASDHRPPPAFRPDQVDEAEATDAELAADVWDLRPAGTTADLTDHNDGAPLRRAKAITKGSARLRFLSAHQARMLAEDVANGYRDASVATAV